MSKVCCAEAPAGAAAKNHRVAGPAIGPSRASSVVAWFVTMSSAPATIAPPDERTVADTKRRNGSEWAT